jgi:hypothetical protein
MALERPDPPESSRLQAIEGLRQSRKKTLAAEVSGGAPPVISDPHQVFTLDPQDIIAGAGLGAAKAVGWRYLAGQAEGIAAGGSSPSPTVVAEVTEQDGVPRFSHRQEGWLAKQTRQTMDIAAKIPEVSSGSYDLRMLRLPSVKHIDALWLKNKGSGEDLIIPIASNSPKVVAGQTYTAGNFLTLVRALAQEPSFDNSPRESLPL